MRWRTSPLIICMAFLWTCLITCVKTEEPVKVQPRDPILLEELLEEDLDDLPEATSREDTGSEIEED